MSEPAFHIDERTLAGGMHVIEASGELDMEAAPELKRRLLEAVESGRTRIAFDLTGATFMDSSAIGVLALGVRRVRPSGGTVTVVCTDENILETFEVIGLKRVLPVHRSREEALFELSGVPRPRA
jgi:anti-anti-sigma factor